MSTSDLLMCSFDCDWGVGGDFVETKIEKEFIQPWRNYEKLFAHQEWLKIMGENVSEWWKKYFQDLLTSINL